MKIDWTIVISFIIAGSILVLAERFILDPLVTNLETRIG